MNTGVMCMQVLNQLRRQRLKLQASHKQLLSCMNLVEEEQAWQDHVPRLSGPMQHHKAAVQVGASTDHVTNTRSVWSRILDGVSSLASVLLGWHSHHCRRIALIQGDDAGDQGLAHSK